MTALARRPSALVLVGLVLATVMIASCTSTKLPSPEEAQRLGSATDPGSDPNATVSGVTPVTAVEEQDPLLDPDSPLAKRSVFFQYDSFVVQPEFQPVIETHARYLTSHQDRQVVIEGNTDESGSREYNLALGQRRADAVRRALTGLGVADAQMESISFGEEKPRALGGDEESLAENRRADLNYR